MTPCLTSRRSISRLVFTPVVIVSALLFNGQETAAQSAAEADAMQEVCGSCHTVEFVVSRNRSKAQWSAILDKMVNLGASGTDTQFRYVARYILTQLTTVNVNKAPASEMTLLLGLPAPAAAAIVAEREQQPLRELKDLARVTELDPETLQTLEDRIIFSSGE